MDAMIELLGKRYSEPEWFLFEEVSDHVGGPNRRADALAVSAFPSRGLIAHGFEIKSYRSDWIRELKNPEKSVAVQKYCDHWWIVAHHGVVLPDDDFPANWGLMEPSSGFKKLVVLKKAPLLESTKWDRSFVAVLIRSIFKHQRGIKIRAFDEGKKSGLDECAKKGPNDQFSHERRSLMSRIESMEQAMKEFEEKSGLKLSSDFFSDHSAGTIGDAVKKLTSQYYRTSSLDSLKRVRNHAVQELEYFKKVIDEDIQIVEGLSQTDNKEKPNG